MRKNRIAVLTLVFLAAAAILWVSPSAYATNGMNLEGYGPIATGMGGASTAYDNGTAATMNNPATLGLMPQGNRLDVALGYLGPHITTSMPGMPDAKSSATAFFMPAIGWAQKSGQYTYGVGVFSQGGMGTKYGAGSSLAMGTGDYVGSQLGVGRVIIPLAYEVNPDLSIGASVDYVWANLNLKMALPGAAFGQLVTGYSGLTQAQVQGIGSQQDVRLDFWSGGAFGGAATGAGYAGKLGVVYKINPAVTVGASYHSKTKLNDLKTKSDGAVLSAGSPGAMGAIGIGKITVRDFQWPETYTVGVAWQAQPQKLLVAFDVKQINWKSVMKDFKMTYDGPVMGTNASVDFALPQDWKNQTVYELGAAYTLDPVWTLRAGLNIANNPIPDTYLNYLFPAIEKDHVTIGAGYLISQAQSVDASFTYAPKVRQTGNGFTTSHSQTNAQLMYSYRF